MKERYLHIFNYILQSPTSSHFGPCVIHWIQCVTQM